MTEGSYDTLHAAEDAARRERAYVESIRDAEAPRPSKPAAPRSRTRLDSHDRCRRELAKLYREARDGLRSAQDVQHLASVLERLARLSERA